MGEKDKAPGDANSRKEKESVPKEKESIPDDKEGKNMKLK